MELRSNNVKAQRYLRAGFDPPNWALAPMAKAYAHRCSLPRIGIGIGVGVGVGVGVDNSFRKSMQTVFLVSAPSMRMGGASELQRELGVHCNSEKQRQKGNDIGGNGVDKSTSDENKQLPIGDDDNQHKSPKRSLLLLLRNFMKCSPRAIIKALLSFLQQYSRQVTISAAVGSLVGLCYLGFKFTAVPSPTIVPYSDLVWSVQSGTVTQALFEEGSRRIFYNMTQPKNVDDDVASGLKSNLTQNSATENKNGLVSRIEEMNGSKWHYSTRRIKYDESHLLSLMREHGVTYCSAPQPITASIRSILLTIICLWIPLTPLIWIIVRQISANSSSAPKRRSSKQVVRFEDVAGVDVAKSELIEIVSCLQGAINFSKLGAKLPKGVLLVGPPGTGKTLLARAVAGEAEVPFFATSASEFVELFVGRGAARIRDLFNVARKCAPSIIFIDELDAVGGRRGRSFNDERDQTLNQLLTEMDGFESGTGVLVIAATNRPEALDSALCRPGRFSRRVFVREPSVDGRREILAIHLRGMPLQEDPEIVCNFVASITSGFVGADLANVVNEAALLAARQGNNAVTLANLREAVHRAKFGIGDKTVLPTIIGKEIGRWFPWIPSKTQRTINDNNDEQPWGYQTLT